MTIKDNSPLDGNTGTKYYLNNANFAGTELFFTDSNDYLYLCVLRRENSYTNRANIIDEVKLEGVSNGTDYNYRIDCKNYIQIPHSDLTLSLYSGSTYYTTQTKPVSEIYLVMDSGEFTATGTTFYSYETIETNYDKHIKVTDLTSATSGLDAYYSYIFQDYTDFNDYGLKYQSTFYNNSYFTVNLDEDLLVSTSAVTFYDSSNTIISSVPYIITGTDSGITTIFYSVPNNSTKCILQINYDGTLYSYTINSANLCAKNQYFYYGIYRPIDSIEFTGVRTKSNVVERRNIYFGKRKKTIGINETNKYIQNTGLNLTEIKIFDLFKSPLLFEFSGTTITEWDIDELYVDGYNTKTFDGRNSVLNLSKRVIDKRYTAIDNSFFS